MSPRFVLTPVAWTALGVAMILQVAWVMQPVPLWLRCLPLVLTGVTMASPSSGLIVFAGLGPLAGALGVMAGPLGARGTVLEQLALSVIIGVAVRHARRPESLRLSAPAIVLGVIAAASAAVAQPDLVMRDLPGESAATYLTSLLTGVYFERAPTWVPLHAAVLMIEGLALAVAVERVVRARPAVARSVVLMAVTGTAALAGLNLERLLTAAIRSGDFVRALPELLLNVRVSRFYDVNAAGSVFVLMLFASFGLAAGPARMRAGLAALVAVMLGGLWTTGSRTALAVFGGLAMAAATWTAWASRGRLRWIAGVSLALIVVVAVFAVSRYPAARNLEASHALRIRVILAQTAMQMWRAAPVFGIGIGRFHSESARYGAEAIRSELGYGLVNENAHNYFLQVLAECGAIGLAGLLAVLLLAFMPGGARAEPIGRWLTVGIVAYGLTWLAGHPQLVPDAAMLFWLLFGALVALTAPPTSFRTTAVAAVIVAALVVSAPFRVFEAISRVDLEHVGIGLSPWQHQPDGASYREAGEQFSLYLPADGSVVRVPMRAAPGGAVLRVRIEARGRTLSEIEVPPDAWREVTVTLRPEGRRFEFATFSVVPQPGAIETAGTVRLQVGRAVARQP